MLGNWDAAAASGAVVDAQYDLGTLTEDIIGCIAFGSELGSQLLSKAENEDVADRDFMLKEIVMLTANPMHKFLSSSAHKARLAQIQEQGGERANALIAHAFASAAKAGGGAAGAAAGAQPGEGEEGAGKGKARGGRAIDLSENMVTVMKRTQTDADGTGAAGEQGKAVDRMTDEEIKDEILTVKGAGHETTSNTLSWALLLLAQHPEALAAAQAEADSVLRGKDTCAFDDVERLQYVQWVVYETLRIYPTVPSFPREAVRATTVGGFQIPRGSKVFVSQVPSCLVLLLPTPALPSLMSSSSSSCRRCR